MQHGLFHKLWKYLNPFSPRPPNPVDRSFNYVDQKTWQATQRLLIDLREQALSQSQVKDHSAPTFNPKMCDSSKLD